MDAGVFSRSERGRMKMVSKFPLGDGKRYLRVESMKFSLGLACFAQCVMDDGNGCYSFVLFQDYNKVLVEARDVRATEKAIRAVHAEGLKLVDKALAEARAMYGVKAAA